MYEINKRIREEMDRQNLNCSDLARISGLNRSSISRYVNDVIEPKQNAVGAISKALHVSVSWLLFGEGGEVISEIELNKLSSENRARLLAYYQALIDSQQ